MVLGLYKFNSKPNIMKKLMLILAMLTLVVAASCTPESLASDQQQIDKEDYQIPPNG